MPNTTTALQQQLIGGDTTDWQKTVTFNQFDPSFGTLVDVRITVTDALNGTYAIENLGATSATIGMFMQNMIQVAGPANTVMATAYAYATTPVTLAAYDGTSDFAGASGTLVSGVTGSGTSSPVYTPSTAELAQFTGTGTVSLTATASATINASSDGNVLLQSLSSTGAIIGLQYDYVVPSSGGDSSGGGSVTTTFVTPVGTFIIDPPDGALTTAAQTRSVSTATTGWSDALIFDQFDPALGSLLSVNVTLSSDLLASLGAENLGPSSTTVSTTDQGIVTLSLPGKGSPLVAAAGVSDMLSLGGYDQTTDFAGTSGQLHQGLTASGSNSTQLINGDLSAFIGTGTVVTPIVSTGTATIGGPGNVLMQLLTEAGASATLSYTYLPADLACFASGTAIETPDGPVAVEDLRVGQIVTAHFQGSAPIVWIGRRQVDCRRHPSPATVWPVLIRAGAFAPEQPLRDLHLSPDHAVFCNGVLIPIRLLVNGRSIVQTPVDTITYVHIELARHDIVLAEGLPAESFLDTGNRSAFINGGRVVQAYPDFASLVWEAEGCAPLEVSGPRLAAVRERLSRRADLMAAASHAGRQPARRRA